MPGPMLDHLAAVARAARREADLRQIDIATAADVSHGLVSHFERARAWPKDPDRIVAAYASEVGVPAIELWRRALRAWSNDRL